MNIFYLCWKKIKKYNDVVFSMFVKRTLKSIFVTSERENSLKPIDARYIVMFFCLHDRLEKRDRDDVEEDEDTVVNNRNDSLVPLPTSLADTATTREIEGENVYERTNDLFSRGIRRRRRRRRIMSDDVDHEEEEEEEEEGRRRRATTTTVVPELVASILEGDDRGDENDDDEIPEYLARLFCIWRTLNERSGRLNLRVPEPPRQLLSGLPAPPIPFLRRNIATQNARGGAQQRQSSNVATISPIINGGGGFVLRFPHALILAMTDRDFTADDYDILIALDGGVNSMQQRGIPIEKLNERCPSKTFRSCSRRNEDDACVICLEIPNSRAQVRQMPTCKHVFHSNCVEKWLENHDQCPCCKTPVLTEIIEAIAAAR